MNSLIYVNLMYALVVFSPLVIVLLGLVTKTIMFKYLETIRNRPEGSKISLVVKVTKTALYLITILIMFQLSIILLTMEINIVGKGYISFYSSFFILFYSLALKISGFGIGISYIYTCKNISDFIRVKKEYLGIYIMIFAQLMLSLIAVCKILG